MIERLIFALCAVLRGLWTMKALMVSNGAFVVYERSVPFRMNGTVRSEQTAYAVGNQWSMPLKWADVKNVSVVSKSVKTITCLPVSAFGLRKLGDDTLRLHYSQTTSKSFLRSADKVVEVRDVI